MKEKIITLVIGILIGAILASGGFLIYKNVKGDNNSTNNGPGQMQNGGQMGQPPSMNGNNSNGGPGGNGGTPPAKPGESNSDNNNQQITENTDNSTNSNT